MTVRENVLVGAMFGKRGVGRAEAERRADEALGHVGLDARADDDAEDLTLMEEKRLEIARALATRPTVLLLDEVMAGLRPAEAREAVALVKRLRDAGLTIVFIEHVMPVVRDLADRVLVINYGKVLTTGSYAEVTQDPRVVEAYLGTDAEEANP
jgi:branched-chain amino acid transport system ATP-binding protein